MRAATPWARKFRRPIHRRHWTVLATCAVASIGENAKADAERDDTSTGKTTACLAWNAATECPTSLETARAIEDVLGRRLFKGTSCDLRVNASLRRDERQNWEAELSFARKDGTALGTRTLQSPSPSCKSLKNPISLVVALMVEDTEAQATLRVPKEPEPLDRHTIVFTNLAGSKGLLPTADLGTTLGMDFLAGSWFPSRVDTTVWMPESATPAGRGGHFWAWQAGLAACPTRGTVDSVRGGFCIGTQAGVMHGRGLGLSPTDSATRAYVDLETRAIVSVPVWASLALTAYVGAAIPLLRPQFAYLDTSGASVDVHRTSAVVLLAGLGLELPIVAKQTVAATP